MTTVEPNPYLTGNFAPVHEEITAADLAVTGEIPVELEGRYLRNGPNPLEVREPASYHWFTGDGMVHGVRLRGGRAEWYRNRWVRSASVAAALGEPTRPGPCHADFDFAPNTNVVGHAGRTLAVVEAGPLPYELTYGLDTVGPTNFAGTLEGGYSAHPKLDPDTGELHTISYFWAWGDKVRYNVVGADGLVRRTLDVEVGGPVSMHDLSITERNVVLYDLPVVFDLEAATSGSLFPYHWDPEYTARVGVLRQGGDQVRWLEVDPCYVFHPLNAYDDGDDRVVCDVIRYDHVFAESRIGPHDTPPTLDRWTIDLAVGKVITERLDDRPQEFPRVDERRVGRPHRYGYAAGLSGGGITGCDGSLVKHDLHQGRSEVRSLGIDAGAAEAVFVPRHRDAAEDDGWVLALVYEPSVDRSNLLILNAADFTGPPQAVVHLPRRVPFGFHGNWVADADVPPSS